MLAHRHRAWFLLDALSSDYDNPRLQWEFSPSAWAGGQQCFRDGRVGRVHWNRSASAWQSAVQGEDGPHEVSVRVWSEGGLRLSGTCSCPARSVCEHMAAVLCAVRERRLSPEHPSVRVRGEAEPGKDLGALEAWTRAARLAELAEPPEPSPPGKRLAYVLKLEPPGAGRPSRIAVEAHAVLVRKDGSSGRNSPYDLGAAITGGRGNAARYVDDEDRLLWFRLTRLRRGAEASSATEPALGRDREATALFREFVATGRCHLGTLDGPPLRYEDARRGDLRWRTDAVGRQRIVVALPSDSGEPEEAPVLLPLRPLHFCDPSSGRTGPVSLALPESLATSLVDLPVLEPETVAQLPAELGRHLDELGLPRPVHRTVEWESRAEPVPRLRLAVDRSRAAGPDGLANARALVSFEYGRVRVEVGPEYDSSEPDAVLVVGLQVRKVGRDGLEESRRLEQLSSFGLMQSEESGEIIRAEGVSWAWLCEHAAPELRRQGWTVDIDESFPVQPLAEGEWFLDVRASDEASADWFGLGLGVEIDGVRVDLLPTVVSAIRSGRLVRDRIRVDAPDMPLRLEDGRWVLLPGRRLAVILDTLVELFDGRLVDGRLPMNPADSGRLLALEGFTWRGNEGLRTLAEQLTGRVPRPEIDAPSGLCTELRDYQLAGLRWLALLRGHGFGGVLADDMGLGKTVQTLAHLLLEKDAGRLDRPCLVVAPRTVLANWQRECERFAPALECAVFHGPGRDEVLETMRPDVVLTTYALLHRDERLQTQRWHVVVLDEAQAIKNPQTAAAQAARALDARQRLCLTGTPMENNLEELWSLLAFATPGLLGSRRDFARHYRGPIERDGDSHRFDALSLRVAPFLLRRTKAQVLSELPPKTEVMLTVPMGRHQRDLYESVRMTMESRVRRALRDRGLARSQIVVLDALLKLRQVCCHPSLVRSHAAHHAEAGSAKTERLLELLTELLTAGRRAIVFSQFTSMLDVIAEQLDALEIEHRQITGQTRQRQPVVDAFQAGEFPVLLVSLKAGGTGINLTAADVVIHYDPWWNPAVEAQATDRAHRIGQTRPVTVYRLVCEGTVEQGVLALQERKRALTDALQRDAEQRSTGGLRLETADVERLLAPLEE